MLETAWESRRAPDQWGYSSAGRAPALQAGGQGFESPYLQEAIIGAPRPGLTDAPDGKLAFRTKRTEKTEGAFEECP